MNEQTRQRPARTARERVAQRRAASTGRVRKRQHRLGCNSLLLGGLAALVVLGLLGIFLLLRTRSTLQAIEQADPRQEAAEVAAGVQGNPNALEPVPDLLRGPFNVLLIGVDLRPNTDEGVRSDTLILVHVDPQGKWASMLSIPRDSVVNIPHLGQQKINGAYSYGYANAAEIYGANTSPAAGGGALAAETVEGFLGVRVDYIAQVDFRGFERIVNTLGGIRVDVPRPLLDAQFPTEDYGVERIYIPAGIQVMDGTTALRYARSRHGSSDFDRSRRQQQVLQAILNEVRGRGLLDQAALLPGLARDFEQSVATTLPISDFEALRGLAELARALQPEDILRLSINPADVALEGEYGSDLYWNTADIAAIVARMQSGPEGRAVAGDTQPEVARVQVQNGAGVPLLAGRVTVRLQQQGFTMAEAGDAPGLYEHTLIIDYTKQPETRQRLAEVLGIEDQFVLATPPSDLPLPSPETDIVVILGNDYRENWAGAP